MKKFVDRQIGLVGDERKAMLDKIGVESVEELIAQVIPADIRLRKPLALGEALSEWEYAVRIRALAEKNTPLRSFIAIVSQSGAREKGGKTVEFWAQTLANPRQT